MLIFVKRKKNIFQHFSDVLFELFLKPTYNTQTKKGKGMIFFNTLDLKSLTSDMYQTPLALMSEGKS